MLRTLFAGAMLSIATIILAPIAVLAHVLRIDEANGRVQQWCMRTWARAICFGGGVKLVLHGAEQLHEHEGVVYVSNHVSWFDIFALASLLPRYTFVAKEELRRIPIFGWGAEGAGVVFLARENRKSAFASYEIVARKVAAGQSVIVCPEGTRGTDYHLRPFKKGPFVLAIAAAAPVVPVVVTGTREIMPKGAFRVRSGTVHVHLLPPVSAAGLTYESRHDLMNTVWTRMAKFLGETYGVVSTEFDDGMTAHAD